MPSKRRWKLLEWSRRLGVRAALFAVVGIAAALLALPAHRLEFLDVLGSIGADSVGDILTIMASSMLAATTFLLAVAVVAAAGATLGMPPGR
jgi:uncharacterized membrane protein